ncbi:MAG: GT-D fold domain-containing glycosyltransferase [Bacilli bacterium]|jgi:glycosyltransferase family protein|nr:GT-D fold domain-containing glycosyltransferase [Bacilli bacterium]
MNTDKTIDYIEENHCSVSRFGDGEIEIMLGISINFQDSTKELIRRLREVASFSENDKTFLCCIPDIFRGKKYNKVNYESYRFWDLRAAMFQGYWRKFFTARTLGDSLFSRFYMGRKTVNFERVISKIKRLFQDKNILFVEGDNSKLGVGNDLFGDIFSDKRKIARILCPDRNAFSFYSTILPTVLNYAPYYDVVIMALGPTASVLSFDLYQSGFWALDMGHIDIEYMWYLLKAKTKVTIPNKMVSEVSNTVEDTKNDNKYLRQIITRIGC